MMSSNDGDKLTAHHFVDEAGTPTIFDRRGKVILGEDGNSAYFILGKLDIEDSPALDREMKALRDEVVNDPYFRNVPSLDPQRGRTAVAFHAKDDPPEIRYRAFQLLKKHPVHFSAVIRDKAALAKEVQARNTADPRYRFRENELYDDLVQHLYKGGFHEADHFEIWFSRRGEKDRREAFRRALERAQENYEVRFGVKASHTTEIIIGQPKDHVGLQAVDYFLWALQRLYEKGEGRYWESVLDRVQLVYDMDDKRAENFGRYYNKAHPLTPETRKEKG